MTRSSLGTNTNINVSTRYRMRVSKHPSGLLISNDDGELVAMESDVPLEPDNPLRLVYQGLSSVDQGYVVSSNGELLDVEGAEDAAAAFRAAMKPILDSAHAAPEVAGLLASFEAMLTPEAMVASAAEFWNSLV